MAEREKLIEEIKGLEKNQSNFSLKDIDEEIRKRNESPYTEITDYADIPQSNPRSEAIESYLASPQFRRLALEILGGVAGAATGGTFFAARAALRPALGLLYRSLGAGIGEGAAAGAAQIFDPRDDLAKEVLRGFATGMSAEGIGAAIPAIISKIGFKGVKYTDDAEKAERLLSQVKAEQLAKGTSKVEDIKKGIITPGIGSDNRFVDILENISEKSIFAGGKIVKARKGGETALTNELNILIDNLSDTATRTDAGELAIGAVQNSLDNFRAIAKIKYDKLSKTAEGVAVDVTKSKRLANELLKRTEIVKKLLPETRKVLQTVAGIPNKVTFAVANDIRSELLGVTRASTEMIKGKAQANAVRLVKELTNDIDATIDSVSAVSPQLRSLYDSAQRFYRVGAKKFNNKVLRRLTEKAPEEIYKTLIKPRRPSTIQALSSSLKLTKDKELKKELFDSLKGTLIGDIAGESNRLKGGLDGTYILKELDKYGDDVLSQLFKPNELNNLRDVLRSLSVAQKKSVGEGVPGAIFIQLGQAGAAFGLFSGILTAPSAAILFGPAVVSELFTNPKFIRFIKKGFRLNPGSKEAYTNASQLIGAMISNNLISKDEGEDYLEELRKSREEDILGKTGQLPIEPTPSEPLDIDLSMPEQVSNVPPLNTPNINPNLFAQAPTGIMQNLSNTERALLSPEEQVIRQRTRT
tara:strand:- start:2 stop:2092 length:2091 start_codon:yes stop_codon:yes gene_type:complete